VEWMDVPESPPIPVLDEHDTAAVVALLIRAVRIVDALEADEALIEEAQKRIAANREARTRGLAALGVFGFEPGPDIWDRVRQSIGFDAYMDGFRKARGQELPELLEHMGEEREVSKTDESAFSIEDSVGSARHPVPVRDAILRHLRAVGNAGTKVADVRRHLSEAYGMNLHEKTPGMTLYRLLKDGLARREGRTWYAIMDEEEDENEAPNGGAAGASEAGGTAIPSNHQPELTHD
jgi:hypothetical protein